ncbi:hypothetical protein L1887_34682 [Cichorium endivia]|nr:hypothetical protein L1887_34682 [Cichorium endivia]
MVKKCGGGGETKVLSVVEHKWVQPSITSNRQSLDERLQIEQYPTTIDEQRCNQKQKTMSGGSFGKRATILSGEMEKSAMGRERRKGNLGKEA